MPKRHQKDVPQLSTAAPPEFSLPDFSDRIKEVCIRLASQQADFFQEVATTRDLELYAKICEANAELVRDLCRLLE